MFATDSSFNTMQLSTRVLPSNVAATCNVWLILCDSDATSLSRLVWVTFQRAMLFGEALDPLLIKNKDNHSVFPLGKKE